MKAILIAAAVVLSACSSPSDESVVTATGAGVTESLGVPAMAIAAPTVNAAGAGSSAKSAPAAANAKGKRQ